MQTYLMSKFFLFSNGCLRGPRMADPLPLLVQRGVSEVAKPDQAAS